MISEIEVPRAHGTQRAWLATPEGNGPHRAVLVMHEMWGLVDNLHPILERFASEGYVALAPDLFDRKWSYVRCVARAMKAMQQGQGEAVEDVHAALQWLHERPDVDESRSAVVGFCMGGGFALVLALSGQVAVAAPFYGSSDAFIEDASASCPVVASFGGRDKVFAKEAKRVEEALSRANVRHDLKVYPDAGHSFMARERGNWLERLSAIGPLKVGFDEHASEDSWRRMLGFFDETLA